MLMKRMIKRRYNKSKMIANQKIQMTDKFFIDKACGEEQHRIWKPGEVKEI